MKESESNSETRQETPNRPGQYELFTKVIKAGRKTYFFDIRQSRSEELYLVITESAKKIDEDGNSFYKRHKIFVSREDLLQFREGIDNSLEFLNSIPEGTNPSKNTESEKVDDIQEGVPSDSTISNFDDLDD